MSWFSRLVNVFRSDRLGNERQVRETSRDVKLLPWLDAVVRDVRYGFRMLCKSPVVTTAAILSLALAIGACTAAYTLISGSVGTALLAAGDQEAFRHAMNHQDGNGFQFPP